MKKVEGFVEPNYTQIPNDIFLLMADMGKAELKVMLALCRLTFGFHRFRCRASLTVLQEMTGLSRASILIGADQAVERGLIDKIDGRGVTEWVVKVVNQQIVRVLNRSGKGSEPPSIKQKVKQSNDNRNKYISGKFGHLVNNWDEMES